MFVLELNFYKKLIKEWGFYGFYSILIELVDGKFVWFIGYICICLVISVN